MSKFRILALLILCGLLTSFSAKAEDVQPGVSPKLEPLGNLKGSSFDKLRDTFGNPSNLLPGRRCTGARFKYKTTVVDGVYISAKCLDKSGIIRDTEIELYGITNQDGLLDQKYPSGKDSEFSSTCGQVLFVPTRGGSFFLYAECLDANGNKNLTGIALQNIQNNNGRLEYNDTTGIGE
jgi:hypothetical protein